MWDIGGLKIDGRAVLGPMAGYTFRSYREFMRPFGVSLSFTEMISEKGIIHGQSRTQDYYMFEDTHPTAVQLFGSVPDELAEAAKKVVEVNPNTSVIDINMGCPVLKVNRCGAGAQLMRDPKRCGDIIRAVKHSVDVPVTAKIRLGWDSNHINFREVIRELTDAGVDAVSLHARTKDQHYSGDPHYELIEGLREEMDVPLIISGNIFLLEDALEAVRITGADAVMVARGGVGNPFLVTQIDRYFRTGERLCNPTIAQQADWCLQLIDMMLDEKGEDFTMRKLRSFAPKFISGFYRCREYRRILGFEVRDRAQLKDMLDIIVAKMGDERINDYGRSVNSDDF